MNGGRTAGLQNLFTLATRERCISNLKKQKVPPQWKALTPDAAVLVPLCRVNGITSLLYTVRAANLRSHGGQISFPGGKIDENESPVQAALRETEEEIGLKPEKIDIWGCGSAIPGRNRNVMITPVVGSILELTQDDLRINSKEVAEVFAVPIETLCDPKNQYYTQFKNGFILPVFVAERYKIWGITAYITHSFLHCLLPKDIYNNNWMNKKVKENDLVNKYYEPEK